MNIPVAMSHSYITHPLYNIHHRSCNQESLGGSHLPQANILSPSNAMLVRYTLSSNCHWVTRESPVWCGVEVWVVRLQSFMAPDWQADTRSRLESRREVRGPGWGRLARSL